MKKIISLLLALVCLTSIWSASAEVNFKLRNGVTFGETAESVKAKETWTLLEGMHFFQYQGALMGMPSLVLYNFGSEEYAKEDSLISVYYCVNTCYDEEGKTHYSTCSAFKLLCMQLSLKYGDGVTDPASLRQIQVDPFIRIYTYLLTCLSMAGSADFESISIDYSRAAWVIPAGDRDVVIDLMEYEVTQNGQPCYLTLLKYSAYTEQELQDFQRYVSSLVDAEL